jgi:hypothetical protein
MSEEIELESIETNLKNKLNNSVKNHLIKNEDFKKYLEIDDDKKTAIVYRIRINKKHYYIRFSTPFTEVSAFTKSNPAKIYTSLKDRVKVNEREYNFVMFLFLLKLRETEMTEMVEPELRDDVSLFDRQDRQKAFDSFKLSYPDEKINIRDDVILEVPQVVVCGKLLTFEEYQKQEKKSCAMMGGKTKRKSKKRMIKRKSKKRVIKRKSKKRVIKRN